MGQGSSSALRLEEVSAEVLASLVEALGPRYAYAAEAIRENAVDGELLNSLDEGGFQETLQDLSVTRLHQRVLTKEWMKWKERDNQSAREKNQGADSGKRITSNKDTARALAKAHPELLVEHNITISQEKRQELVDAAASLEFSDNTPESELEGFDRTASKAFDQCKALYAGVHLLEDDGHYALGARFVSFENGELSKDRIHVPREMSRCYGAILGETTDYVVQRMEPGNCPFQSPDKSSQYIANVIHTPDHKRIGVVCAEVDEEDSVEQAEERHAILQELASEAEGLLNTRKALLDRTKVLQDQINQLKMSKENMAPVLPSYGPVQAITRQDLVRRGPSPYPMPDELASSNKTRNTSELPIVREHRATSEEMSHLPTNFYGLADEMGATYAPIPKKDAERVAVVEALRLHELKRDSPTGLALQRLVAMGAKLFGVPFAEISFQNHKDYFSFARYSSCSQEEKDRMAKFYHTINEDKCGEPWLRSLPEGGRCLSLCIYPTSIERTMTIHDVWNDETFKWIGAYNGFKFYSGSPIFVSGHVVATFCMMDFRPRNDFTQAHEMQQEQIAMLISQQIETWALRRDVESLEKERKRLERPLMKSAPPNDHCALVMTDVQSSTSLWEADSNAMNEAIVLHDKIMRACLVNHSGYEVTTEGDAFQVAFHDAIDAVSFALEAQVALHEAPWSEAILTLPESCDDGKGFRGLRVRMAIHAGDVFCRDNEVSGRREYAGPTVNICKSLEDMAHGGQIVVSSDVWNVASYLSEAKLGSPQVLDLGNHVLLSGESKRDGLVAKNVLQLVPSQLAFDYTCYRTLSTVTVKSSGGQRGRCFPPTKSTRRRSSSFHDAPYENNYGTFLFVYASQVEMVYRDKYPSTILAVLSNRIGVLLAARPGYQCKDLMLVFGSPSEAISFGLTLQEYLKDNLVADESLAGLLQVGVHEGRFSSMGPNRITGRADYYGTAVNRAARVASATLPGQVCFGVIAQDSGDDSVPLLNDGLKASFLGRRLLKGVQKEMALFGCSRS